MTELRIGVAGYDGRMGRAIREAATEWEGLSIVAGVTRNAPETAGGPVYLTSDPSTLAGQIDVLIDVSAPEVMIPTLESTVVAGIPYLSGVTGLGPAHHETLDRAASSIPVLYAANFSIGVALMTRLLGIAATALPDADVEIVETHHRRKKDAPSGTALVLIDAIAATRDAAPVVTMGRSGMSLRLPGEIGIHSLRGGGVPGEHRVSFLLEGEEIVIEHRALSRAAFAEGALRAASWLVQQPPGRYSMQDVVGERAVLS